MSDIVYNEETDVFTYYLFFANNIIFQILPFLAQVSTAYISVYLKMTIVLLFITHSNTTIIHYALKY